jgi:Flp pilus assembly protein TadD
VLLLSLGRGAESIALLEEAARSAPDDPEILFLLATVLDDLGKTREAVERYLQAAQAGSQSPQLPLYLAEARMKLGETEAARQALEELVKRKGTAPPVRERAAALLEELSGGKR